MKTNGDFARNLIVSVRHVLSKQARPLTEEGRAQAWDPTDYRGLASAANLRVHGEARRADAADSKAMVFFSARAPARENGAATPLAPSAQLPSSVKRGSYFGAAMRTSSEDVERLKHESARLKQVPNAGRRRRRAGLERWPGRCAACSQMCHVLGARR